MVTTTVTADDLFTKLLVEAQFQAYENSIARQITSVFNVAGQSGKVIQVPVYGSTTAISLQEGVAPSADDVTTSGVDITLSEIGVYHRVSDFLRDSAARDVMADLGMNMGQAIAEKMDADVFALFSSFGTDVGAAGSELTADLLFKAAATLRARKVTGPFYAVVHPAAGYALKKQLTDAGAAAIGSRSDVGNAVLQSAFIGSVAGIQVYESGLLGINTDGDSVGAVFAPNAIGLAVRGDMTMETQRQAAARATDIAMTMVKGQSIINDNFGVKLTVDSVI